MSPTKKEIAPRRAKERVGDETSSQSASIIQESLPTTPTVHYQRSGSKRRHRLAASQLANSSQNEEVVPLEREVDVDMVTDYIIGRIIEETAVPLECSRANVSRRQASVFDRLDPSINRQDWPSILPVWPKCPPISLNRPHLFNSLLEENQHGQPQLGTANEFAHRYMHPPPRNRLERRVVLALMWTNQRLIMRKEKA
ncbi:Hypothetical predicted protein [Olea europaea subsp. europaea]|uniref:Uncharacterized protein n=1 Tax=Olea europaea subsp. europaea TaxID=158383 RepID=A0A8S0TRE5_OLEEU|nr:Hypothetical predicted protein [Olea europaea subsp. europaea]